MFEIYYTNLAEEQLFILKKDLGLKKRYKAVVKSIKLLAINPRHPSLCTHEFTSMKGPGGTKIFEAYVEQKTPAAFRIFWYYGPSKKQITILTITSHP